MLDLQVVHAPDFAACTANAASGDDLKSDSNRFRYHRLAVGLRIQRSKILFFGQPNQKGPCSGEQGPFTFFLATQSPSDAIIRGALDSQTAARKFASPFRQPTLRYRPRQSLLPVPRSGFAAKPSSRKPLGFPSLRRTANSRRACQPTTLRPGYPRLPARSLRERPADAVSGDFTGSCPVELLPARLPATPRSDKLAAVRPVRLQTRG
jgi:hypothetical protein